MNEALRSVNVDDTHDSGDEDNGFTLTTDFFDPIAALLSSIGGEAENLTEELRKYGIKYEHLSGLVDEDLTILGLKNTKIREEVLAEISCLPNQVEHYEIALKTLDLHNYIQGVLSKVSSHTETLNALLGLIQLRIDCQHVENVLIERDKYAAAEARTLCRRLHERTAYINNILNKIGQGQLNKTFRHWPKYLKKTYIFKNVCLASLFLYGTYLGMKAFKLYTR
ncbi:uncharacterized protein LOC129762595 isoform X1 [Toxorhynchites rutilus septentrionalis]|uniref:uncharacterized protein LOC129762595 isoform X1 n=1 Tax=Toxorhynchites rutilus septentrionalis TaxID=329112 RepID=UPI00247A333B|nr:uncharacterized protein LOC129762595 isoform X1 [Toxorhynchites rutilus septentrionalis]